MNRKLDIMRGSCNMNVTSASSVSVFRFVILYCANPDSHRCVVGNCSSFLVFWSYAPISFQCIFCQNVIHFFLNIHKKGKAVPLQAWTDPEGSRKLMLPDFVTTAQDGGRLSALRTGCLYPQEILLVPISATGW